MQNLRVGTSGWSYPEWKTTIYQGVAQSRWLNRYAEVFDTVEANITYRKDLTVDVANRWTASVPDSFRFVMKAHQRATHFNRLKNPSQDVATQAEQARMLGSHLGLVYFQMPHNFIRDDALLDRFLDQWPRDIDAVWEFLHLSWHDPEVLDLLRSHTAGWVVSDAKSEEPEFVATSDDLYVRLRRDEYTVQRIERIAQALATTNNSRSWLYVRHGRDAPSLADSVKSKMSGAI